MNLIEHPKIPGVWRCGLLTKHVFQGQDEIRSLASVVDGEMQKRRPIMTLLSESLGAWDKVC
jgi:hypothetical protein